MLFFKAIKLSRLEQCVDYTKGSTNLVSSLNYDWTKPKEKPKEQLKCNLTLFTMSAFNVQALQTYSQLNWIVYGNKYDSMKKKRSLKNVLKLILNWAS